MEELVFVDSLYTGYHRRGEEDLKNANIFLRTCGLTPEQGKSLKNGSRDERLFMAYEIMKVQVSEMLACLFPGFPDEQTNVSEWDVGSKRYLNILSQGRALLINEARNLKSLSIRSSNGTFPFCFRTDLETPYL